MKNKIMKNAIIISTFSLSCWLLTPVARSEELQNPDSLVALSQQLDSKISHVDSGGQWSLDEKEGMYRIVAYTGGFDHIKSVIHLQWLALDPDLEKYTVHQTAPIKECNKLVGFIVKSVKIAQIGEAYYALIHYRTKEYKGEAANGSIINWKDAEIKIKLGTPGAYAVEK